MVLDVTLCEAKLIKEDTPREEPALPARILEPEQVRAFCGAASRHHAHQHQPLVESHINEWLSQNPSIEILDRTLCFGGEDGTVSVMYYYSSQPAGEHREQVKLFWGSASERYTSFNHPLIEREINSWLLENPQIEIIERIAVNGGYKGQVSMLLAYRNLL